MTNKTWIAEMRLKDRERVTREAMVANLGWVEQRLGIQIIMIHWILVTLSLELIKIIAIPIDIMYFNDSIRIQEKNNSIVK